MVEEIRVTTETCNVLLKNYHYVHAANQAKGLQLFEALSTLLALVYAWALCREKISLDIKVHTSEKEHAPVDKLTATHVIPAPLPKETEELNDTEKEIMIYTAKGLNQKEIAERLPITADGVTKCRKRLYPKLGIEHSVHALTAYVILHKWVV
jgi:DNA-binding CsgD family transcriptional regulator